MKMAPEITNNLEKIIETCQKMQLKSLHVFGSAAREADYSVKSDLDFLIEYNRDNEGMPPQQFDYFDFMFTLEDITGRNVDIVIEHGIKNKYFRQAIEKEKILLYAA